jgi:hypothetical protein
MIPVGFVPDFVDFLVVSTVGIAEGMGQSSLFVLGVVAVEASSQDVEVVAALEAVCESSVDVPLEVARVPEIQDVGQGIYGDDQALFGLEDKVEVLADCL